MPKESSKQKESKASKVEKCERTNQHKAAKALALANVQVSDSESDSEGSKNGAADNNKGTAKTRDATRDAPKEAEKDIPCAYRSNCNHYVHVPDKDGIYTCWEVLEKPTPKDVGKNWNIREHMGLDGDKDAKNLYNDIVSFIRNHTQVETQDMANAQWKDISSATKERVNIKALNRFGYLLRFKHNWATEEIMKRNLHNTRDTKSRINKAGGHSRWKAQERTKREAQKTQATTQANSSPQAPSNTAQAEPGPSQVVRPKQKSTSAQDKAAGETVESNASSKGKERESANEQDTRDKGKKRALPLNNTESDHKDHEDTQQPKTSIKSKRRRIDDSSDKGEDAPESSNSKCVKPQVTAPSTSAKANPKHKAVPQVETLGSDEEEPVPPSKKSKVSTHEDITAEERESALSRQIEALVEQMEALKAKKSTPLPPSPPRSEDGPTLMVKPKPRPKPVHPTVDSSATGAIPPVQPPSPQPVPTTPAEPEIPKPTVADFGPAHSPVTQPRAKKAGRPKKSAPKAATRKVKEELIEAAVEAEPSTHKSTRHRN